MVRQICLFETTDGRRFEAEADAARHERLLQMAEAAADLEDLMLDVLYLSPELQRAVERGDMEFDLVARLAGWMLTPSARADVGEVLRIADGGVPASGRGVGSQAADVQH